MTSKTPPKDGNVLQVPRRPDQSPEQATADAAMSAVVRGSLTARAWSSSGPFAGLGANEALAVTEARAREAADGDLEAAKRVLIAQAMTLDAMFNDMARKAAGLMRNKDDGSWSFSADTMEAVTRIAFKAQGQCRATLQTLGELVNPRAVAFIKQAPGAQTNLSTGPQQVNNNGVAAPDAAHAGKPEKAAIELLEDNPSERLDTRAQATTGRGNPALETVGAIHRAEVGGGKVSQLPKRHKARAA